MEINLVGEIKIMKEMDIKPNFSELSRKYNIDRHTVKKIYENDGLIARKTSSRSSMWDEYLEEIIELMSGDTVSKKAAYMYLINKYEGKLTGTYNGFKWYTLHKGIELKKNNKPHVLYEVDPGEQLQVDWKENMKIHLEDNSVIKFNVFSATLGYSREHVFIYTTTKTTDDFIRCIIETFRKLGGVSEKVLTDNMSAVVSVNGKNKKVIPKINQVFKDLNCKLELCKARTPETKGKTENSNKFVKWIYAYDYKLKSEAELIDVIQNTITAQSNQQINSGTKLPPHTLFRKEKEYLKPLPSKILLESYIEEHYRATVPSTLLLDYKGKKYSVAPAYVGKRVDIYPIDNCIYIYYNKQLITKHNITQNTINYHKEHYEKSLSIMIKNSEIDIEAAANRNLKRLEKLGNV